MAVQVGLSGEQLAAMSASVWGIVKVDIQVGSQTVATYELFTASSAAIWQFTGMFSFMNDQVLISTILLVTLVAVICLHRKLANVDLCNRSFSCSIRIL